MAESNTIFEAEVVLKQRTHSIVFFRIGMTAVGVVDVVGVDVEVVEVDLHLERVGDDDDVHVDVA